ncbi:unnamed protein product [Gemmata massiliana]|uniref:Zinc-ribbon domain-containing protein n=1 Tax=Gemmata massiliana TaxID=1210884 RepID=A0A6P2CT37_9BACT|nr:zinc-ribbon domain-containing protein [Gemmata massiliana]VTR92288.1 unnamed protein product [Gemmata massiliana]
MARTRPGAPDEDEDNEFDGDDYDAETDYDPEDPETYPAGLYVDDSRAFIPCPYCRAEIDDESEQCPKCGMFISREDTPSDRKSPVWIVLMVLALLAVMAMALG